MASEAPPFWWQKADWRAWCLWPISALYGYIAHHRLVTARRVPVAAPVLCIGNFTVGGEGKTPVAIALAKQAMSSGRKPGFLSRGHGGSLSEPHLVDTEHDAARLVGDEPLLLAAHAPVVVTPDRAAGAERLIAEGCDFIIMDDGFQSARIQIDYALMVVDARRGLGNGHVIPGGPLRGRLVDQLRYADAVVTMGEGEAADPVVRQTARAGKPVFHAHLKPRGAYAIKGRRFLAFAGIGNPQKFFDTVSAAGGVVVTAWPFPDHHLFNDDDVKELRRAASSAGLELITTQKDHVRLSHGSASMGKLAEETTVLEVEAEFAAANMPLRFINETREAWRKRSAI